MTEQKRKDVYLDCDLGVDDSLALCYLMASPLVNLVGVGTVSGNTRATTAARNALDLLAIGGRDDVPVAVGSCDFRTHPFKGGVEHIHGDNGIGNAELPHTSRQPVEGESASQMIIRLSHEYEGNFHMVAVGPLTNLAEALESDPSLPSRVASVTIMGGAVRVPGNVSAVAEANIGNDPEAARIVLSADWNVMLVPLDVTMANIFEESDRQMLLDGPNEVGKAVGGIMDFYFDFHVPEYGRRCSALHDPLAAAICAGGIVPEVAPAVPVCVDDTQGPGRGQTICDLRGQRNGWHDVEGANVRVALSVKENVADHLVGVIEA